MVVFSGWLVARLRGVPEILGGWVSQQPPPLPWALAIMAVKQRFPTGPV